MRLFPGGSAYTSHSICFCLGCLAASRYHRHIAYVVGILVGALAGLALGKLISEFTDLDAELSMPTLSLAGMLIAALLICCYFKRKTDALAGLSDQTEAILTAGADAREQMEKAQQNVTQSIEALSDTVDRMQTQRQEDLARLEERSEQTQKRFHDALAESAAAMEQARAFA